MNNFNALWLSQTNDSTIETTVRKTKLEELSEGDVYIQSDYSSLNFTDALATQAKSGVIRSYPIIPGIDVSGKIIQSNQADLPVGTNVLVTGYGLGVSHTGGLSEIISVPHEWVVKTPKQATNREVMCLGTAGFTAALAIHALETKGEMTPKNQPNILVTGASGGVGSLAIQMLKQLGYTNVWALSRKKDSAQEFFQKIGATQVFTPEEITPDKKRPLLSQQFHYIIDTVGGHQLEVLLPQMYYGGSLALCGNAGGISYTTTVLPHILRSVNLFGIDSVAVPMSLRTRIWDRMVTEMKPADLSQHIQQEITLENVPDACQTILKGQMQGRYLVRLTN